jgi:hypothetical protein
VIANKPTFAVQNEMSALGQKPTYALQQPMSSLPPKADMCGAAKDVRYLPDALGIDRCLFV